MEIIASITILNNNRQRNSPDLNKLLSKNGGLIMSRMGVNVQKTCTDNCSGLIVLVIKSKLEKASTLFKEIKKIDNIKAEMSVFEDSF